MTTLYKITGLLALLILTSFAQAAPEAEYKKVTKSWTLEADGSQEYRYGMELTIFTHTAMNSTYGESFILYNPEYQELKIHTSYTRQVDGTVIETPENAFVEVLPRFAADAPAYNHLKEMVVVHTGLELGATIYLDYSIRTKPGYYPALDIYEFLQETSPVKEYQASINVPENSPFHYQLLASDAKATETVQGGKKTIRYTLRNVPASSREPFQPQNKNEVPCLAATTYSSPEAALAVIEKELSKGQQLEAVGFAEYITEQGKDDKEKSELIRKHLVDNMATSSIPFDQIGYKARDMETVLRSAYGTTIEKAGLLNIMLKAAGIPSEILIIYPSNLQKEVCGLKAIKSFAVKSRINKEDNYYTATSLTPSTLPYRSTLDKAVRLSGEEWAVLPLPMEINAKKELTVSKEQGKEGYVICTLPGHTAGIDTWGMQTLNSKRNGILEIPAQLKEEIVYTIEVKDGLKLQTITQPVTISKPFGTLSQTITTQGDKVEVKRIIELHKNQYSPAEYKDLRELINGWVNPANRILLFGY